MSSYSPSSEFRHEVNEMPEMRTACHSMPEQGEDTEKRTGRCPSDNGRNGMGGTAASDKVHLDTRGKKD